MGLESTDKFLKLIWEMQQHGGNTYAWDREPPRVYDSHFGTCIGGLLEIERSFVVPLVEISRREKARTLGVRLGSVCHYWYECSKCWQPMLCSGWHIGQPHIYKHVHCPTQAAIDAEQHRPHW